MCLCRQVRQFNYAPSVGAINSPVQQVSEMFPFLRGKMNATSATCIAFLLTILAIRNETKSLDQQVTQRVNKLLVLSLDGFAHNYLSTYPDETKTLRDYFISNGLHASNGMIAPFTPHTLAVHFSMVTGLYEESTGIVGNYFYDPQLNDSFRCGSNSNDQKWFNDQAEPIWSLAEKQNVSTLILNWFGSEVNFTANFLKPAKTREFSRTDLKVDLETAIDTLVNTQVTLAMIYHHEPDNTSHATGIDSMETRQEIAKIDSALAWLASRLKNEKLEDKINIMIVADHGMANVNHSYYLLDMAPNITNCTSHMDEGGTVLSLWIHNETGCLETVYDQLKNVSQSDLLFSVYKKNEIPENYHFRASNRIGDILLVAKSGTHVVRDQMVYKEWKRPRGDHGYDNFLPEMRPIFIARGPNFKKGVQMQPCEIINYYSLISTLTNITVNPSNSSIECFKQFINVHSSSDSVISSAILIIFSLLLSRFN